jgi:hypothetical protein
MSAETARSLDASRAESKSSLKEPSTSVAATDDTAGAAEPYRGPESIVEAKTAADRLAVAIEAVRRGDAEVEEKRAAILDLSLRQREADRTVGLMLTEGRAAGDLPREEDGRPKKGSAAPTLSDLGIQKDYAADVAALAEVPDNAWATLLQQARERQNPSRAAITTAARQYLAELKAAHQTAQERSEAEARRHADAVASITELESYQPPLDVPPLTEAELSFRPTGALMDMSAALPKNLISYPPGAKETEALARRITALGQDLKDHRPVLMEGVMTAGQVMAIRVAVQRLITNATLLMRAVNEQYDDE